MDSSSGPWGPPSGEPARTAGPEAVEVPLVPVGVRRPGTRSRCRRGLTLGLGAAAITGAFALAVTTPPDAPISADGPPSVPVTVPMAESGLEPTAAPTIVEVLAPVPPTAAAAPTVPAPAPAPTPTPTTVPTGSAQGCDELRVLVDTDGDSWGECVPDLEGAHARSQAIVTFLGYTELTCITDPATAASTCEALTVDGAVRTLVVELTGVVSRNDETRPAPTTTTTAPPPTAPPAPVPFADTGAGNQCDPNYTGCVPIDSDVDCAGGSGNGPSYVRGPVRIIGSDIYGLDRDNDGIGCE